MGKVETQESAWVHTGGHPDHTGAASVVWSSADAEEKTELHFKPFIAFKRTYTCQQDRDDLLVLLLPRSGTHLTYILCGPAGNTNQAADGAWERSTKRA